MKNALILLAGGTGKRLGSKEPKQFLKIGNTNLIEYFLTNLDSEIFDIIIITIRNKDRKTYLKSIKKRFNNHNIRFATAGETRQISSRNSLQVLKKYNPKNVLIHDSARPLATNFLIKRIIKTLSKNTSCIPFITYNDLVKTKNIINLKK